MKIVVAGGTVVLSPPLGFTSAGSSDVESDCPRTDRIDIEDRVVTRATGSPPTRSVPIRLGRSARERRMPRDLDATSTTLCVAARSPRNAYLERGRQAIQAAAYGPRGGDFRNRGNDSDVMYLLLAACVCRVSDRRGKDVLRIPPSSMRSPGLCCRSFSLSGRLAGNCA